LSFCSGTRREGVLELRHLERLSADQSIWTKEVERRGRRSVHSGRVDVVDLDRDRRRRPRARRVEAHDDHGAIDRVDRAVRAATREPLRERIEAHDRARVERVSASCDEEEGLRADHRIARDRRVDGDERIEHRVSRHDVLLGTQRRTTSRAVQIFPARDRGANHARE
jgi:hypothetical protein